jgi:NAD+ kinase
MTRKFKTIGLIGKSADPGIGNAIHGISQHLETAGVQVILDKRTATKIHITNLPTAERDELGRHCDLVIVVGGDGTMLNAARKLCDHGVPLVGVNLGRLGFLADVSPNETREKIDEILDGQYEVEERFLLAARVMRNGKEINSGIALNDVVVHKWHVAHMIETDTYINDHFVHTHRSDGIITATPTGSTAYALSGGGPIIQPGLEALEIVPICPHTLSHRPIAVKASSKVKIVLSETGRNKGQVTCDGQFLHELEIGDEILIEKKSKRLQLLHPKGYDYYHILRAKLHWAEHP